jgi:hypothetical protein
LELKDIRPYLDNFALNLTKDVVISLRYRIPPQQALNVSQLRDLLDGFDVNLAIVIEWKILALEPVTGYHITWERLSSLVPETIHQIAPIHLWPGNYCRNQGHLLVDVGTKTDDLSHPILYVELARYLPRLNPLTVNFDLVVNTAQDLEGVIR